MNASYDAVVVGAGFGGSINALRLAETGRSVLVLERGRRYGIGEFPRDVTDSDRLFWRYPAHPASLGLYQLRFFSGIATVTASGVGGGSLVYANIHIRPDPVVFDDPRWPQELNRASLDPYYDKVARQLAVAPVPAEIVLPKRERLYAAARQLGRDIFDPDEAVSWLEPGGPGREACRLCGECEFGCQHGAKNTLDYTYLAEALNRGAHLRTGAQVTHVEPTASGYRVHLLDIAQATRHAVEARRVVLSAGTHGTTELLLRSRDEYRSLPKLSRRLGYGFSGNGDFLGSIEGASEDLQPSLGPDVTSVLRYFDAEPRFTMVTPTFNRPANAVLASIGQPDLKWLRPFAGPLWRRTGKLAIWMLRRGLLSRPLRFSAPGAGPADRYANVFAIGQDNANGRVVLRRGRLDVIWNYARENHALVNRMIHEMTALAGAYGGHFAPLGTWRFARRIISVHPLGGCRVSERPEDGVVSPHGEVHGYPGLFVADGSVIPTSIGFHPVMTISAVSERIAEAVVGSFAGVG